MLIHDITKVCGSTKVYCSHKEAMTELWYNKISIPTWIGFWFSFLIFFPRYSLPGFLPHSFNSPFSLLWPLLLYPNTYRDLLDFWNLLVKNQFWCFFFLGWGEGGGVHYRASISFGVSLDIIQFHLSKWKKIWNKENTKANRFQLWSFYKFATL